MCDFNDQGKPVASHDSLNRQMLSSEPGFLKRLKHLSFTIFNDFRAFNKEV